MSRESDEMMFGSMNPLFCQMIKNRATDFKGFVLPIRTTVSSESGLASSVLADDAAFLTRGHPHRERVSLEGATVQVEKPTPPAHNV